jgi:hypothetical protein
MHPPANLSSQLLWASLKGLPERHRIPVDLAASQRIAAKRNWPINRVAQVLRTL